MKGQINVLPFIMIFVVIVIGATSFYFYTKTSEVSIAISTIEYDNFIRGINQRINEYAFSKKQGSSESFSFNIPKNMEKICFIDKDNEMNQFSNPELDLKRNLETDKNIFFEPNEYPSTKLEFFEVSDNPLCIKPINNKISLKFESLGNKTKIIATNEKEIEEDKCIALSYNGDVTEKIDVVFLGLGYDNSKELTNDAFIYITNIFKDVYPINSNFNKFNFYQINEPVENCQITNYIKCNNFEVKKQASVCPNDYIIILTNRNKILNIASPIRSSAIQNLIKVNTADNILVLAHEFGHGFGDLADEYVDDTYYSKFDLKVEDLPNCDKLPCESWDNVNGTSCYKGCTLSNYYRPTKNSIMNFYFKEGGDIFGPVNEQILIEKFNLYK